MSEELSLEEQREEMRLKIVAGDRHLDFLWTIKPTSPEGQLVRDQDIEATAETVAVLRREIFVIDEQIRRKALENQTY